MIPTTPRIHYKTPTGNLLAFGFFVDNIMRISQYLSDHTDHTVQRYTLFSCCYDDDSRICRYVFTRLFDHHLNSLHSVSLVCILTPDGFDPSQMSIANL